MGDGRMVDQDYNAEVTKMQHKNYVRNTRAIAVLWFIFSACVTILSVIVFIQPFWIGDTNESPGVGYFGLFEFCEKVQGADYTCTGSFLDFNTIKNDYFRVSSSLVGISVLLFIFSIICMILFLFIKPSSVLRLCGWMQVLAGIGVAVACIVFPNSWDDKDVRLICGQEAIAYNYGKCEIKWGYILAIVIIFDDIILAILAFVLAAKQAKMAPEFEAKKKDLTYVHDWRDDGHTNHGFSSDIFFASKHSNSISKDYDNVEPESAAIDDCGAMETPRTDDADDDKRSTHSSKKSGPSSTGSVYEQQHVDIHL